jgi:hypothetical protein
MNESTGSCESLKAVGLPCASGAAPGQFDRQPLSDSEDSAGAFCPTRPSPYRERLEMNPGAPVSQCEGLGTPVQSQRWSRECASEQWLGEGVS